MNALSRNLSVLSRNGMSRGTAVVSALRMKHTLPDLPYDYNALEPVGIVCCLCGIKRWGTYCVSV